MVKKSLPQLTLVLGGASSGKSAVAEKLITECGLMRDYIATAQALDAEMATKIQDHQAERGPDWTTHEAPLDVANVLNGITKGRSVLLDCATMWLTNHMMAKSDLSSRTDDLLASLRSCASPVVVVSNEVGLGGVPANAMARDFARRQGRLNAQIAGTADQVLFVIAGIPQVLK